jgi:signal transduction histidine kinase
VVGDWDSARLDQVLTNLISNVLKYSPEGGDIRVGIQPAGEIVEVAVSDHGIGIPLEEQERLFQPFARAAGSDHWAGGQGLGLYISAQIVRAHGGTITIQSQPGAGSTFLIRLPVKLAPPVAADQ